MRCLLLRLGPADRQLLMTPRQVDYYAGQAQAPMSLLEPSYLVMMMMVVAKSASPA